MTMTVALKCQHHLYHNLQQDTFASLLSLTPCHITYLKPVLLLLSHLFLDFSSKRFPRGYCYHSAVCSGATIYGHDGQGLESRHQEEIFSSTEPSRPALGPTQLPSLWVLGLLPVGGRFSPCTLLPVHRWMLARACRRASAHLIASEISSNKKEAILVFLVLMHSDFHLAVSNNLCKILEFYVFCVFVIQCLLTSNKMYLPGKCRYLI